MVVAEFPPMPSYVPAVIGYWEANGKNKSREHRIAWLVGTLPTSRRQRYFGYACAKRAVSTSDDGLLLDALKAAYNIAEHELSDTHTVREFDNIRSYLRQRVSRWVDYTRHNHCSPKDRLINELCYDLLHINSVHAAVESSGAAVYVAGHRGVKATQIDRLSKAERMDQSRLLTLFTSPAKWSDDWVTYQAASIAQKIHDDQDWSGLPILADALEEARCDVVWLLTFLRDPIALHHASRGWWFIDRLRQGSQEGRS